MKLLRRLWWCWWWQIHQFNFKEAFPKNSASCVYCGKTWAQEFKDTF